VQDTDDIVGDDAYSGIRRATKEVAALYRYEFGRLPTRTEWQRLLLDALQPVEEESAIVEGDLRPRAVLIET
jgi:hypothetical protein